MFTNMKFYLLAATVLFFLDTSLAINCYQCSGSDPTKPFQCNEWLNSDIDIQPESCDNIYGARYCVKHTGRFEATSISCYQCSVKDSLACSDGMIHMGGQEPHSCDHVFEAQYCVKSTSLDGGIGAKRFCSSLDLGNYCNYVRQPGDILSYRTCVFTCSGEGCNSSSRLTPSTLIPMMLLSFILCKVSLLVIR